jgi:hypothetical protein
MLHGGAMSNANTGKRDNADQSMMASTKNDTQCMKEHLQSSLLCVRKEEPRI